VTESRLSQKTCIPDRDKARKDLKVRSTRFLRKCNWEVQRILASRENSKKGAAGSLSV
jgi:hypothetical protein